MKGTRRMVTRTSRSEEINSVVETSTDRRRFGLTADEWTAFIEAPDAPLRELPRMRRLFDEPGIFEAMHPDEGPTHRD
jgi:uncharacterized protein (DUF1778 family)